MLTFKNKNNNNYINTFITQEDISSDRDFYFNNLLNIGVENNINNIIDNEVVDISANHLSIGFNVFFLRHILEMEINEISRYTEKEFQEHLFETKLAFGLIDESGQALTKLVNSPFENRQPSGILEPTIRADKNAQLNKQDLNIKKPRLSGYPIFYNTFTFPYWDNRNSWINDKLFFIRKPFFNNSFILLELYDSTDPLTQRKIANLPIYNNIDYTLSEKFSDFETVIPRPSYQIRNGDNGFSFTLPKKYDINEIYVKFSYWDALNNKKINLIPSYQSYGFINNSAISKSNIVLSNPKKWIQDLNGFNQNARYLKYVINNETNKYRMYEYNYNTNEHDIQKSNFDLYELFFDDFWANTPVINKQPKNYTVDPQIILNPVDFNIPNINISKSLNKFDLKPDINNVTPKLTLNFNNSEGFQSILDNLFKYFEENYEKNYRMTRVKSSKFDIPLINQYIFGIGDNVIKFTGTNIDTKNVVIKNIQMNDLVVFSGNDTFSSSVNILSKDNNSITSSKFLVNETLTFGKRVPVNFNANNVLFQILIYNDMIVKILKRNYYGGAQDLSQNNFIITDFIETRISDLAKENLIEFYKEINVDFNTAELTNIESVEENLLAVQERLNFLQKNDYEKLLSVYYGFFQKFSGQLVRDSDGIYAFDFIDVNYIKSQVSYNLPKLINEVKNYILQYRYFGYLNDFVVNNNTVGDLLNNLNNPKYNPFADITNPLLSKGLDKPYNVRDGFIDTILTLKVTNGFTVKPNESFEISLDFIYGDNLKHYISGDTIIVRGKIMITIDHDDDTKNIYIPTVFTYKTEI